MGVPRWLPFFFYTSDANWRKREREKQEMFASGIKLHSDYQAKLDFKLDQIESGSHMEAHFDKTD